MSKNGLTRIYSDRFAIRSVRLPTGLFLMALALASQALALPQQQPPEPLELRAWGVPDSTSATIGSQVDTQILEAFQQKYPHIKPVSTTGLVFEGRTMDITPLMQIAGDIAPDVLYVNFRQSSTYIQNRFLYPLDRYIEQTVAQDDQFHIPAGHLMELDEYLAVLEKLPGYEVELKERVPKQCWVVMRRVCPYELECSQLEEWGEAPAKKHYHTWAFPQGPLVIALYYRRDLFYEAGLPDRAPETFDEMFDWAKKLTNPKENRYGIFLGLAELSWSTLSFLYSNGGLLVDQNEQNQWRCVYDSPQAVDAYHFVSRLLHEPFENQWGKFAGVVALGDISDVGQGGGEMKVAMRFGYIDQSIFSQSDTELWNFGPVPKSPQGTRGSEFNSRMTGIYAGLENNKPLRDAAWQYIRFRDGPEARQIRARMFVENGLGKFVQPKLLVSSGYPELVRQVPKGWQGAYDEALKNGIPEPYGTNCQMVYTYASHAIDEIRNDSVVTKAIRTGNAVEAKKRIGEILAQSVIRSNEKMLGVWTPEQRSERILVASIVAGVIFISFVLLFRRVARVFSATQPSEIGRKKRGLQIKRYGMAYLLLTPALLSIALWAYYPLVRGTAMAFQDYNVRGFSTWVGMENFARVLYDFEFWYAMWISLKYALMYMVFGFGAPIALAFLLTEIPRGKLLFRTIYYLPAVLTGVVVMFLWKGFYGPYGMINTVLNYGVEALNYCLPFLKIELFTTKWLESPRFAMFFCLLPTIWAGMGPGCLIYLAALKTVPEELYEAADIDGAGILGKMFGIALPGIKGLIIINFIGAMIGVIRGGGEMMLAMTGGGPYTPFGQTEVVGLHIFWQAFGYLRFGIATAMAWVLGSILIGFTVIQMQKLSNMEFKSAAGSDA